MLNVVTIQGRICNDPIVKATANDYTYASFMLACERPKNKNGEELTDFLPCIAFGKKAEFIQKYCTKGRMVIVSGRNQSRDYDGSDGKKHTTYEILVSEINFCDSQKKDDRIDF